MNLDYNIAMELAVIPLDIMLYTFLVLRYNNLTKVNAAFKRFALVVMVANITDVVTAIVTSAHDRVPNAVHYIFNTADSMLAALAGFYFIYYVYAYVKMEEGHYRIRNIINGTLLAIDYILLITNHFTHFVFYYDEGGNYIHQPLFTLVAYGFPIIFFLIGCSYMLTHWHDYKKTQVYTMIGAMVIAGLFFLIQMLFFDNVLVTFYVASLGLLVIYLSLETPDYEKLLDTMKKLHESEAREAANEAKARLSQEVMMSLSMAVDAKDHYTNGHSARVAKYARELAKRLGMSEKEQEEIFSMGLLHDIGKIGVPEEILNKPGKLTDEEFDKIKSHTVVGHHILSTITEIPGLAIGARWHHERFDGRGYPDGLSGEDIPKEARIICMADCYDAMTSRRSYSFPRAQQDVRAEILRCKGTQFDPDIADAMIALMDEDTEYRLREIVDQLEDHD